MAYGVVELVKIHSYPRHILQKDISKALSERQHNLLQRSLLRDRCRLSISSTVLQVARVVLRCRPLSEFLHFPSNSSSYSTLLVQQRTEENCLHTVAWNRKFSSQRFIHDSLDTNLEDVLPWAKEIIQLKLNFENAIRN